MELFDLNRFVKAQDAYDSYSTALQEVKNGCKESHWMWYIFPQMRGLGHTSTSQKYGITSLLEAKAYLEHDTLNSRLYEIMNALPVLGDADDIFGELDAMKLRSCLTLFDIVSPEDIFNDFLDNYFDKERCQLTLKIVADELSNYSGDNAFRRHGITVVPRAFFESGVVESESATYNQKIGTLLDLINRGETMRKLVSRYLWDKDLSAYRVSGVENDLSSKLRTIFQAIADNANDESLTKEMNDLFNKYCYSENSNVLMIADAFDGFWKEHEDDPRVASVANQYCNDSLCKL